MYGDDIGHKQLISDIDIIRKMGVLIRLFSAYSFTRIRYVMVMTTTLTRFHKVKSCVLPMPNLFQILIAIHANHSNHTAL